MSVSNVSPQNSWNRAGLMAFTTRDSQQAMYPGRGAQVRVQQLDRHPASDYGFQSASLVTLEILHRSAGPIEDSDNWTRFVHLVIGTDTAGRESMMIRTARC